MRFLAILAALPLAACGAGAHTGSPIGDDGRAGAPSGTGTTRSFAVDGFTGVELAGSDDVVVTVGGAFSVRAEGAAEDLDKLDIRRDGSTLKVGRKRNALGWSRSKGKGVRVHVTMPAIRAATLAGSGNLGIDRVQAGDFAGALSGSGDLTLGQVSATTATFDLAGSGAIAARGRVDRLKVSIAGSGDVDAAALTAQRADISIAGSGNVSAAVDGPAAVSILGSGDVTLGGRPRCTTSKMGSGTVRCG